MDIDSHFYTFIVGAICGAIIAAIAALIGVAVSGDDSINDDLHTTCDYLGGTWHKDVCIKDGKLIIYGEDK